MQTHTICINVSTSVHIQTHFLNNVCTHMYVHTETLCVCIHICVCTTAFRYMLSRKDLPICPTLFFSFLLLHHGYFSPWTATIIGSFRNVASGCTGHLFIGIFWRCRGVIKLVACRSDHCTTQYCCLDRCVLDLQHFVTSSLNVLGSGNIKQKMKMQSLLWTNIVQFQ